MTMKSDINAEMMAREWASRRPEPMRLMDAIKILCDFHLREDPDLGHVVEAVGAEQIAEAPEIYAEAWRILFHSRPREQHAEPLEAIVGTENLQALEKEARDNPFARAVFDQFVQGAYRGATSQQIMAWLIQGLSASMIEQRRLQALATETLMRTPRPIFIAD